MYGMLFLSINSDHSSARGERLNHLLAIRWLAIVLDIRQVISEWLHCFAIEIRHKK